MDNEPRKVFSLKLSTSEREELKAYAKRQGYSTLAEMIRSKLLQLARQDRQAA